VSSGALFGREREVAALSSVIQASRQHGSVLVVTGEPGIGKSALLAAARDAARAAGCTVLGAVGVESEMHLPFGGVHQMLTPLMGNLGRLSRAHRDALGTALGLSDSSRPDLFLIAEATLLLLRLERRERPVIVIVDDVQWLDPQSHQILAFVAHRGAAARLSVLAAVRAGHPGPLPDAGFAQLPVRGVDDQTAEEILRAHAGGLNPSDLRRIRREAMGNPLALEELPRAWGAGPLTDDHPPALTDRLERAFAGRVAGLLAATRDALLIAAVGSSSDTQEILAALPALGTPGSPDQVFKPAVLAGLVTESASSVGFRHPLVRSGVLQRETLTRRHAAHRALAEVLAADRYRQTWHRAWSMIGPDDQVADELAATVPDSLRRGAVMSAVSGLERSAQLTTSSGRRGERLLQAAGHAFGAGRADVVARILREAADIDLTDLDQARLAWLTEALNGDVSASPAGVRQLCESARKAHELRDVALALNLLLCAALRCWWADSGAADRRRVVGVLDELTEAGDDPRRLAAISVAEPVLRGSEVLARLRSLRLDQVTDGDSLRTYGMAAYGAGDLVLATDLLDRAERSFRDEGRLGPLPVVLALQLHIRFDLGDWSGAVSASREVNTVSRETGQAVFADNNVPVEARGMALRGEWESALALMADAEAEAAAQGVNDRICLAYQARGSALLSAGRPAEAFDYLKRPFDPSDPGYHLRESFSGIALMAEAAVGCGRTDEARAIVRALEPVAIITPAPLLEVNLGYARAVLAPHDAREPLYQAALEHGLSRWPWLRARVQLEYGRWLIGVGRGDEAAPQLRAASEVFDHIGAVRWSRCAADALARLDERPPEGPGQP
jgi:tetratricopeptide (TPR) repeat protein